MRPRRLLLVVLPTIAALAYLEVRPIVAHAQQQRILAKERVLREVEVSLWEASNAISQSSVELGKAGQEELAKQGREIEELLGAYRAIADREERKVLDQVDQKWRAVATLASSILEYENTRARARVRAFRSVDQMDDLVDFKLQASFVGAARLGERERVVREIEHSIWEAHSTATLFAARPDVQLRSDYDKQVQEVEESRASFVLLIPTAAEAAALAAIDDAWQEARRNMDLVIESSVTLRGMRDSLSDVVAALDDLIDFELQMRLDREARASMPYDLSVLVGIVVMSIVVGAVLLRRRRATRAV